jgi:hypothetical protein
MYQPPFCQYRYVTINKIVHTHTHTHTHKTHTHTQNTHTHTHTHTYTHNTMIPRLTKIIRSGITFVSRNVISRRFL